MTVAIQISDSVVPVLEELLEVDLKASLLGDNIAAITSFHQNAGSWRNRHLRMRAQAGRERVESGMLTVTHVPGTLQVADVGTKPLPVGKLLHLLSIVNVRVSDEEGMGPLAAKFLGRACAVHVSSTRHDPEVPPAVVLALALISSLPGAQGLSLSELGVMGPLVSGMVVEVRAQPGFGYSEALRWAEVSFACLVVLGVVCCVLFMFWVESSLPATEDLVSEEIGETSVRSSDEIPSPRWRTGKPGSSTDAGVTYLIAPQNLANPEGSETCEFPLVGRVDYRSNWVPSHFLRWLLSIVGESLFQFLGLEAVEIWRLRAVAGSFRYGWHLRMKRLEEKGVCGIGVEGVRSMTSRRQVCLGLKVQRKVPWIRKRWRMRRLMR